MLSIYATVLVVCLCSIILGEALLRASGYPGGTHLAPAIGFSALIVLASAVFWLPGHRTSAGVIIAVVSVAAGANVLRGSRRFDLVALITALVTLGAVSIPFFVNRHTGIFGVSIDDDFAAHLTWASSLYNPSVAAYIFPAYPLGPHVLAASLAGLLGTTVEPPFMGILMAVPVLAALTAQSALGRMTPVARIVGGVLVGIPYLVTSYLAEGSYKELMMGLILLGFALTLRQLKQDLDWRARRGVVLGLMLAATLLIDGRVGVVWPLAAAGLWVIVELILTWRVPSKVVIRRAAILVGTVVLVAFVGSVSELTRLLHFSGNVPGGNIPNYISPYETLGIWFSSDFRNPPSDIFRAGLLVGLALAVAVYASIWWIRRRDFAIPMATASSFIIYAVVREQTGPYLTAKALAMMAAPTMLYLVAPLMAAWTPAVKGNISRIAVGIAGLAFTACALWSSGFALRYTRVNSDEHANELASLNRYIHGASVLYLAEDDFSFWELRGARLSSPAEYGGASEIPFTMRKANAIGAAVDVDSIAPGSLENFHYLITTSSHFASEMPPNWRLAATTPYFELWKRTGTTEPRSILDEANAPGAMLNCSTPLGRMLSQSSGIAGVWDPPPVGPDVSWSLGPTVIPASPSGFVMVTTGSILTQNLQLPAGRWELSLAYQSPAHLYLDVGNLRAIIPSNLGLIGPFWKVGDVTSTGMPMTVTLRLQKMRLGLALQSVAVGGLAAVPVPQKVDVVPLHRACGRYVDWYSR